MARNHTSAWLSGQLAEWPTKDRLAAVFRRAGLKIYVGKYSVRVEDCSHFSFENYGGDIGEPTIDADADTPERMVRDARLVSEPLAAAQLRHRFEIYGSGGDLIAYLHYDWPEALAPNISDEDHDRAMAAIAEHRAEAKRQARREMGLPE